MNVYILSYDPFATALTSTQLSVFIRDNRKVLEWYPPFAGTYYLKSHESAAGLNDSFSQIFGDTSYTIAPVVPSVMQGALPPSIWLWLSRGVSALGGLLGNAWSVPPAPPAP